MKEIEDRIILGEGCNYSADTEKTGINNNIIVVGTSGAGKTMSIVEPRLLHTFQSSLVLTVTKRRIVKKYSPVFKKRGYKLVDLNFAFPKSCTHGFDPLKHIRNHQDIRFLAQAIVKADPAYEKSSADPYWPQSGMSLLSAEIGYVMDNSNASFADVLDLHDSLTFEDDGGLIRTSLDSKFAIYEKAHPNSFAVTSWKTFHLLPIKTAACTYSTLNSALNGIFTPEIRDLIKKTDIDFADIATRKTLLFITTSPVNMALKFYTNLFYGTMLKELFEFAELQPDGILPVPIQILCDDFATGSRIPDFDQQISVFREKRISVTLLLQSESQLEALYGSARGTTILNNCDSYVYMGGNDLQTAQKISLRLDLPLEDVLYMPIGQEFVFRRGQRPVTTERFRIFNDLEFTKVTKEYEASVANEFTKNNKKNKTAKKSKQRGGVKSENQNGTVLSSL